METIPRINNKKFKTDIEGYLYFCSYEKVY